MATGRFMQSGSACMMDEFGQLAGWRMSVTHGSRAIETPVARAYAMGTVPIAFARATGVSIALDL